MTLRCATFEMSRTDLLPLPIDPSWIKEGAPLARSVTLSKSPDSLLTAGLGRALPTEESEGPYVNPPRYT
jgi:hypothetical protein